MWKVVLKTSQNSSGSQEIPKRKEKQQQTPLGEDVQYKFSSTFALGASFIECNAHMCPPEGSIYHDLKQRVQTCPLTTNHLRYYVCQTEFIRKYQLGFPVFAFQQSYY